MLDSESYLFPIFIQFQVKCKVAPFCMVALLGSKQSSLGEGSFGLRSLQFSLKKIKVPLFNSFELFIALCSIGLYISTFTRNSGEIFKILPLLSSPPVQGAKQVVILEYSGLI